jgi:RNA polymerase sigma-70 factor (ECF subfamily)
MPKPLHPNPTPTIWEFRELDQSEAELAERAKRDPEAFAQLYLRYVDPIHRYCYRRLGSREAAEDATSQVFAKALGALPRYRADSFRGWLFTIAHHVVVDSVRAGRHDQSLDADGELADELADAAPSPEELALAADEGRTLRQALAQLPEHQRQVVELRLAGMTGPEIGRALGRKPKHVDVTQFRAIARLRALMGVAVRDKEAGDA